MSHCCWIRHSKYRVINVDNRSSISQVWTEPAEAKTAPNDFTATILTGSTVRIAYTRSELADCNEALRVVGLSINDHGVIIINPEQADSDLLLAKSVAKQADSNLLLVKSVSEYLKVAPVRIKTPPSQW
jgi:hypothetical protein